MLRIRSLVTGMLMVGSLRQNPQASEYLTLGLGCLFMGLEDRLVGDIHGVDDADDRGIDG